MDSQSPSQGFGCSTCGPKKSPTLKSYNFENFCEGRKYSYVNVKKNDDDEGDDEDDLDFTVTGGYEYFDGYEHDQEVQEPKVKIKKKWKGTTGSYDEFYDPEIDDIYLPRSYRRKWIPFGSTHKIAKNVWKSA